MAKNGWTWTEEGSEYTKGGVSVVNNRNSALKGLFVETETNSVASPAADTWGKVKSWGKKKWGEIRNGAAALKRRLLGTDDAEVTAPVEREPILNSLGQPIFESGSPNALQYYGGKEQYGKSCNYFAVINGFIMTGGILPKDTTMESIQGSIGEYNRLYTKVLERPCSKQFF